MVAQAPIRGRGELQRVIPTQEEAGVAESGERVGAFAVFPWITTLLLREGEIPMRPGKAVDRKSLHDDFSAGLDCVVAPDPRKTGVPGGLDVLDVRIKECLARHIRE